MTVCKCLFMIVSIISGICQVSILKQEKDMLVNSEKRASDEVRSMSERVHRLQVEENIETCSCSFLLLVSLSNVHFIFVGDGPPSSCWKMIKTLFPNQDHPTPPPPPLSKIRVRERYPLVKK